LNGNGDSRGAKALTGKDLAQIYNFPDGSGAGEVIAIIELEAPHGSGYRPSELTEYFKGLGVKPPRVIAVSVDGGFNGPGTDPEDPQNADGQVMLDIEVAGAVAPAAQIVVYFAPNTARGFADVIKGAVYDKEHNPTVIALGWGATENPADSMYVQIEQALEDAVQLGVTFCVASGSSGSRDDPNDRQDTVVGFPASHPYALGCGGTRLEVLQADVHERVWEKHSGGGVSRIFPLPDYQADQSVPPALNPAGSVMRGVPDVAGSADPETGYQVTVDGASAVYGGTSAVAALWAGLVARLNEQLGSPVGLLNPILYQYPCLFRDIVTGSNIDYHARKGWDPCTGLGTPDGKALLAACVAGGTGTGPRTPSRA
jgi:kumamolisin